MDVIFIDLKTKNMEETEKTNIKVIIKSRPRIQREIDNHQKEQWEISGNTIQCRNPLHAQLRYTFGKHISHISIRF